MDLANSIFAVVGAWLLGYRLLLNTPCRAAVEVITTLVSGASLALLAPFLPWPPPPGSVVTLAVIGMLLSGGTPCGSLFAALLLSLSLGVGLGGYAWQLGACRAEEHLEVPDLHGIFLTLTSLSFVIVFVCTPGVAGPSTMKVVLAPCLGALLFTSGLAALVPKPFALTAVELLAEGPCTPGHLPLQSFGAWAVVALLGIALQVVYLFFRSREGDNGRLHERLLPDAEEGQAGAANIPRPGEGGKDRYETLRKAIDAPEDADLSHLSEVDRQIVDICRKDEFERDRVLWGGGLI
ncbi:unnamed protein product [Effrenium voratum]|uniref:Uncharacterized protein n=1 Tax=Effrenium voratum TaxID=2562239 RepID=A0AA36NA32_9DINO|nr:unnamed protein product [Effrenium voratum]CAJ1446383.1 unnamed protein product [Effrenium voratum]